tara:strand:- start:4749 stop:4937 length:189 start_codon:yes stop_codon:yes gene_type:complete
MKESAFYNINLDGKRQPGESKKDHKERIFNIKERTKLHLKGRVTWNSRANGTYIKQIHGPLK